MTWAVVRMTCCCCNSLILLARLEPGPLSPARCTFQSTVSNRAGREQQLIHPVLNHLTLVSLMSISDTYSDTLSGFISIRETWVLSLNWLGFLSSMSCSSGWNWGDRSVLLCIFADASWPPYFLKLSLTRPLLLTPIGTTILTTGPNGKSAQIQTTSSEEDEKTNNIWSW